jgi:hypothetical protein
LTNVHDDREAAPPSLNEAVEPIRSNFRTFTILFALYVSTFINQINCHPFVLSTDTFSISHLTTSSITN